ncbi:MAG: hypothetical protein HYR66_12610 [Sphingobacteriales bacterium]|nr:hypothetical protein [Sphingobacteriales bacterium]MBI3717810.1 hypothetical protein [Sphingobacteriales bacterium]
MKKINLSIFFLCAFNLAFSQHGKTSYLLLKMEESTEDNLFKKKFVRIDAENGNFYAKDIYSLRFFDVSRKDSSFSFYDNTKDSIPTVRLYNYFQNSTEALSFLSGKGWELISVTQQISSSYSYERDPTGKFTLVPIITSKPIYYLKKVINSN